MSLDDNLYPRNGAYRPGKPAEQKLEEAKEEAQTLKALPILQEMVERFKERIEFFGSVDAIDDEIVADPEVFMHTVAGNKIAKLNLQAELDYIEELIEQHTKK